MSYNQFQAELSKISSSHLQLPRLYELLFATVALGILYFFIYVVIEFKMLRPNGSTLKGLMILNGIIGLIITIVMVVTFRIIDSEEKQLITTFIEDSSNFTWKEKRSDPLVSFPASAKEGQPIYLKINKHSEFEYNIDIKGEIEYQSERNKNDFEYGLGHFEQKVYWSNDLNKVEGIPSKVSYEYKLKEDTFYKNKDKLPLQFWSKLKFYNTKEKIVFYVPEKTILDKNE